MSALLSDTVGTAQLQCQAHSTSKRNLPGDTAPIMQWLFSFVTPVLSPRLWQVHGRPFLEEMLRTILTHNLVSCVRGIRTIRERETVPVYVLQGGLVVPVRGCED